MALGAAHGEVLISCNTLARLPRRGASGATGAWQGPGAVPPAMATPGQARYHAASRTLAPTHRTPAMPERITRTSSRCGPAAWPQAIRPVVLLLGLAFLSSCAGYPLAPVQAGARSTPVASSPTPRPATTPAPSATPTLWGAVRGSVMTAASPSIPLTGATVLLGSLKTVTSDGTATASTLAGDALTLAPGEFWLPGAPPGAAQLRISYDGVSTTTPVTVTAGAATQLTSPLLLTTPGPVPDGSTALVATFALSGSNPILYEVGRATDSEQLIFPVPMVQLHVKAPPNSRGATVAAYAFTYLGPDDVPLAPSSLHIPITPGIVPPAAPTQSSGAATLSLSVTNYSEALARNWTFAQNFATLQLLLYGLDGGALLGRDQLPLKVRIPCQLIR